MNGIAFVKVIVAILILSGALLSLLTAFGLIRLPDVYNRSHASTKAATLGTLCILLGTFVYFWVIDGVPSAKVLLGILFVFVTLPVSGHLVTRAAYYTGVPLWERTVQDDLAMEHAKQRQKEKEQQQP